MDTLVAASGRTPSARTGSGAAGRHRVRRARNFFLLAVMASLIALAGHCLPGDDGAFASGPGPGNVISR
ncbi:MAG: hypothetical protein DCC58_07020 [Chloroflexi bacterium]|nr:MAG: hypothetical protein DCC58_07020 [Chloroflexota bacterium]